MDGAEEGLGEDASRRQTKANALSLEWALMCVIEHSKKVGDLILTNAATKIFHNCKEISHVVDIKILHPFAIAAAMLAVITQKTRLAGEIEKVILMNANGVLLWRVFFMFISLACARLESLIVVNKWTVCDKNLYLFFRIAELKCILNYMKKDLWVDFPVTIELVGHIVR